MTDVLYEKGSTNIFTILNENDKCIYSGETANDLMLDNSNLKIMPIEKAMVLINYNLKLKYNDKWKRITKEKYFEMLEILPPVKWNTINGVEMFAMSEYMESTYTEHYAIYKNKYYCAIRDITKDRMNLIEELKLQIE